MKHTLLAIALCAAGCTISPVVTDPTARHSDRYSDCRRAAKEYCREVVNPSDDDEDRCVAEHAYRCTSGGS